MCENVIMGWDAAWTPNGSGAWAVARGRGVFIWEPTPTHGGLLPRLDEILGSWKPVVIAMDFPLARGGRVNGWRVADLATTRAFSRHGCPVHSPTASRPGEWGEQVMEILKKHGFEVAVSLPLPKKAVVEVYPHTVLLQLYRSDFRVPYKAGRTSIYWPDLSLERRKQKIREIHAGIHARLQKDWGTGPLPLLPEHPSLSHLKAQEDLLDALLCLTAAKQVRGGDFRPYGDARAAIWNPALEV